MLGEGPFYLSDEEGAELKEIKNHCFMKVPWKNVEGLPPLRAPIPGFRAPTVQFIADRDPQ